MVLFEALHTFSTLVVVYRYCWVDRNPWFMETPRNQCSGIRSGGHGNHSQYRPSAVACDPLSPRDNWSLFFYVLFRGRKGSRFGLSLNFGVCIDHWSLIMGSHYPTHTHTPLATRHCLKWWVDPRFVGRCPISPSPLSTCDLLWEGVKALGLI